MADDKADVVPGNRREEPDQDDERDVELPGAGVDRGGITAGTINNPAATALAIVAWSEGKGKSRPQWGQHQDTGYCPAGTDLGDRGGDRLVDRERAQHPRRRGGLPCLPGRDSANSSRTHNRRGMWTTTRSGSANSASSSTGFHPSCPGVVHYSCSRGDLP